VQRHKIIKTRIFQNFQHNTLSQELMAHFSLFVITCICQFIFFTLSFGYSVLPGFTIWYFPLGFHFILFLILPLRFWLTAMFAIALGGGFTMQYQGSIHYEFIRHFMLSMTIAIHTLPIIYLARMKRKQDNLFALRAIVILVLFGFLTRLCNIGFHFLSDTSVYDKVPTDERISVFLQHNIAAYPGILFAISVYLVYEGLRQKRHHVNDLSWALISKIALSLTVAIIVFFYLSNFSQNILKILLFLPIIWCGYRFTWLGSLCCAMWVNSILFILLYGAENESLVSFQPFIVSYFLIGLVTSGLQLEHRRSRQALSENQLALKAKYAELTQSQHELQALALQIVNLQELEKKNLSQELHDDVGQNITALNISISLLKKQNLFAASEPTVINKIRVMTDQIYSNAYELMYWLRPRSIDDLGLKQTLIGLFFKTRLQEHKIEYHADIHGDVDSLDDGLQIALFRIVQECVKNVIQHSASQTCQLTISFSEHSIHVNFTDSGKGFPESVLNHPFSGGLFNIQNYMMALGGTMLLTNDNGAHIHVQLPR
jgi:glucose-6-phosphate-specific signal transduction histidine kinase